MECCGRRLIGGAAVVERLSRQMALKLTSPNIFPLCKPARRENLGLKLNSDELSWKSHVFTCYHVADMLNVIL